MIAKTIAAIAVALSVANPALALTRATLLDGCGLWSNLAEHIMRARQTRVSLESSLKAASNVATQFQIPWSVMQEVVIQAYQRPVAPTEELRAQAIGDFGDSQMSQCVTELTASDQ